MEYSRTNNSKLMSTGEAVQMIQSNESADYACFLGTLIQLDRGLPKRTGTLQNVKIRSRAYPGITAVAEADPEQDSFIYNNWHFTGGDHLLYENKSCNNILLLYH
jgi:hypothetical protein